MAPKLFILAALVGQTSASDGSATCESPDASEEATLLQGGLRQRQSIKINAGDVDNGASAYIGCFADDPHRDMEVQVPLDNTVTNRYAGCREACSEYKFMALQNQGNDCFCGNSYGTTYRMNGRFMRYLRKDDSECGCAYNRNTAGATTACQECTAESHSCGSYNRNAIYRVQNNGANAYLGCFIDQRARDMRPRMPNTDSYLECRAACSGYLFMAFQSGVQCTCGDSYGSYGQVEDSECNYDSPSNTFNTGGEWRNAVYAMDDGADAYLGCFIDERARDMRGRQTASLPTHMRTNSYAGCRAACSGYPFMALQAGGQCFCGDSYGSYGQVEDSECDGDNAWRHAGSAPHTFNVGGGWRNAVYAIGQ